MTQIKLDFCGKDDQWFTATILDDNGQVLLRGTLANRLVGNEYYALVDGLIITKEVLQSLIGINTIPFEVNRVSRALRDCDAEWILDNLDAEKTQTPRIS